MRRRIQSLGIQLIALYQKVNPWVLPKTCRFYPSCSQYALEAIEKYGLSLGLLKAIGRILRCSPFSRGGCDPVK